MMHIETLPKARQGTLRQLSVYLENKVGKLNELVRLLASHELAIIALSVVENMDNGVVRLLVNYPDKAGKVLSKNGFTYTDGEVLGLEIKSEAAIGQVLSALAEAEINIHYLYCFLMRPEGHSGLVLRLEDLELASSILSARGLKVLDEGDLAR